MKKLALVSLAALVLAACGGTPQACTDMLKNYEDIITKTDNQMLKDQFQQQKSALEQAIKTAGSDAEAQCVKANEGFEKLKQMMESAGAGAAPEAPVVVSETVVDVEVPANPDVEASAQ